MENKRQLAVSAGSQIALRLVGTGVSLFTVKLIASAYGVAGTGVFNTITTYLAWITVVADLGLFSLGVREISRNPKQEQNFFSTLLGLRLITAVVASLVAILLIAILQPGSPLAIGVTIAAAFVFLNLTASAFDIVFQTRLAMQYPALAELLSKITMLVAVFVAYLLQAGLFWTIASIPLSGLVILTTKALMTRRFVRPIPSFNPVQARHLLAASLPLGIVFILNNLYFKVDTLILYTAKGATAVGLYSLAYKVLEVALFAGAYITSSLKPSLSTALRPGQRYAGTIVSSSSSLLLMLSLPLVILLSVFAQPIILLLSTSQFEPSAPLLQILAWSIPLLYFDMLLSEVLIAQGERKILIGIAGFMLAFILVADLLAIAHFGALGAAWATVGSELLLLVINIAFCSRFTKIFPPLVDGIKVIFAAVLMFITALQLVHLPLFFGSSAIIAITVYALSLYLTGSLRFK